MTGGNANETVPDLQAMRHVFQQAQSLGAEAVLSPCTAAHCAACRLAPQKAGSQDSSSPARPPVCESSANPCPNPSRKGDSSLPAIVQAGPLGKPFYSAGSAPALLLQCNHRA